MAEQREREVWPRLSDDLGDLARYASADAVRGLGLADPLSHLRTADPDHRRSRTATVRALYAALAERQIPYKLEPYALDPSEPQIIRHPDELDRDAGTCVDFAVLFASLCLQERLHPLLVVGASGRTGHVLVAVDLDHGLEPEPSRLANGLASSGRWDAIAELVRDDLETGRYLLLDPTGAALGPDGSRAFDDASTRGRETDEVLVDLRRWQQLTWIDVEGVCARRGAYAPLAAAQRPPISRRMPPLPTWVDLEDDRRTAARTRLETATGVVVLHGPPGTGKSMLAIRSAGAFGWVLRASSRSLLRSELAQAEAEQQSGGERSEIASLDEPDLVAQARERLGSTTVPWVVVLDNANLADGTSPEDLLDLLPPPRAGQTILVTSTDARWARVPGATAIELHPLDQLPETPAELRIGGLPLFYFAYQRLQEVAGATWAELAATPRPPGTPDTPQDVLWATATARLPQLAELAHHAAWAAIGEIDLDALADVVGCDPDEAGLLVRAGLAEQGGRGTARVHTLVAEVARAAQGRDLAAAGRTLAAVLESRLPADADSLALARAHLDEARAARGLGPPDPGLDASIGLAAHALGTRLEPTAGVKAAKPLFDLARDLLPAHDARRLADCDHVKVREVYQFHKDVPALTGALVDIEPCLRLREQALVAAEEEQPGGPAAHRAAVDLQRTLALRGLLQVELAGQQLARLADPDPEEPVEADERELLARTMPELARAGAATILESYEHRLHGLGLAATDPDLLRGQFNLGAAGIHLAKLATTPDECRRALDQAEAAYTTVGAARELLRPRVRPHLASCYFGAGLSRFLRAQRATREELSVLDRRALLRRAAEDVARALEIREEIEAEADADEVGKTLALVSKIALARHLLSDRTDPTAWGKELDDLRRDLRIELPDLAARWWPPQA